MNMNLLVSVVQIVGIIGVAYFLLFRPSIQAKKQAEEMQSAIKKGDDIVTAGGIVGKVREVKDQLITIDSGTSTLVVERHRIVRVGNQATQDAR